jgi:hypothetical protein
MATKYIPDAGLEDILDYIVSNCDRLCLCSAEPDTYTKATVTYVLGVKSISNSDFAAYHDVTGGRRTYLLPLTAIPIDTAGTITYLAIVDTSTSTLLAYWACTSTAVTADDSVTTTAAYIQVNDPV